MKRPGLLLLALTLVLIAQPTLAAAPALQVGVAQVDITPDYPIRLNGFGFRRTESEGVTQRIWAKALAFDDGAGRAVLITVDNLAVPDYLTQEVASRLEKKTKLKRTRFTVTCSHTHTAPMLTAVCPTIFGLPIPPEHLEHIDRYTRELTDRMEQAALAALNDLKPARVEFGIGTVGFSTNRRTKGGPVDHDLPVLVVRDLNGQLRAIYTSYACHCVTLSNNKISGDWAGYAQEAIQKNHPGVIALTSVGCGADSNPDSGVTGDRLAAAADQGAQVAVEIERLLKQGLTPLTEKIVTRLDRLTLNFDKHPTREEWQEKAKRTDAVGHHARVQLAKLDRGEKLQTQLSYPIQTWTFGNQLALVFLPGEVVVDYSLRLKREFDRGRIWVNGYANDEPCYIPSERVLKEGGYEGGDAMIYYDRPTKFAPGLEKQIIDEVHRQLPVNFLAPKGTEGIPPRSAPDSLRSLRTKPGLEVQLVAAEPLIASPVAIDWGADGKLWVCEMYDYPMGVNGQWRPGGRVKFLEDTHGDGRYDKVTLFLENLPFPTGVTAWGKGVLICAAPDIIYAEDTNGDGRADVVKKIFTGFYTDNYQARVNSLSLGLDNWIYGANGLLGGVIRGESNGKEVNIRGQDFRMKPDTGEFEPVSGLTQQGRVRDDWGNWFGCDNSTSLRHYPLPDRYLRRNPHVPAPDPGVYLPNYPDSNRVFPISRAPERFNDPGQLNRVTSGCGLGIYRDTWLGGEFYGNAFLCEPVHNLVHREMLEPNSVTFTSHRAADEQSSEFLASTDNWFRPVQVRTGPDGALYVVDMYRFLIEHPRWIQTNRLAQIDTRAGENLGRIYRVVTKGAKLRPVRDLTKLKPAELVAALDSPNGTERDRVHLELMRRKTELPRKEFDSLAFKSALPAVRAQAYSAALTHSTFYDFMLKGLTNDTPAVRRRALQDVEGMMTGKVMRLASFPKFHQIFQQLVTDPDRSVRLQLALSLGESPEAEAGALLARLVPDAVADSWFRAALVSSAVPHAGVLLKTVLAHAGDAPGKQDLLEKLLVTASRSAPPEQLSGVLQSVIPNVNTPVTAAHLRAATALLQGRAATSLDELLAGSAPLRAVAAPLRRLLEHCRTVLHDDAPSPAREPALELFGLLSSKTAADLNLLCDELARAESSRPIVLRALRPAHGNAIAAALVGRWTKLSPAARSEVMGLLLSREEWSAHVLNSVKGGAIQPAEISLADRQRLQQSGNAEIRQQATELFPTAGTSSRGEVLQKYQSALSLTGVASRGAETFAKNCASCHALNGLGHDVGPNLAPLRDKEPEYWLKNILDPNAVIEPRFVGYNLELKDGRSLSGVIKSESSASLVLVSGGGVQENILRSDLVEIRASKLSLMPEGLEQAMTPQDFADLIAFLRQSGPPKTFAGNRPAPITPGTDGSLLLAATTAEIFGGAIAFEPDFKNIGMWQGAADHVAWTAQVDRGATYTVQLDFACAAEAAGNAYVLSAGEAEVRGTVPSTGGWDRYQQAKIGVIRLGPGAHRITVRPAGELKSALMDLRAVRLTRTDAKE